ncbi:hypothetical protein ACIRP3_42325 [Streptomyces sp. NPDC101209]|uniref:hypothetical protein n=1 Tax=Streptomyces sp. NPDC101209 TaxID=3366129 RepID=UPI003823E3D3
MSSELSGVDLGRKALAAVREAANVWSREPMIALFNEVADSAPRYEDFSVWHYRTGFW